MKPIKAIALLVAAWISLTNVQASEKEAPRNSISVNGEAVVVVKPDKILISLGVDTWDKNLEIAKKKNDDITKRALASIRDAGVSAAMIETDLITVSPDMVIERDGNENFKFRSIRGYDVNNRFTVNLNDPAKVEDIVTRVLNAGVNNIYGITFQHTQFKKYREQARDLAMKAAQEKAQKMAAAIGQSIGEPVQISEGSTYREDGSRLRGMSQNAMQNASNAGESDDDGLNSLSAGKIAIRANVKVFFALNSKSR